jgi:hypothetical protein
MFHAPTRSTTVDQARVYTDAIHMLQLLARSSGKSIQRKGKYVHVKEQEYDNSRAVTVITRGFGCDAQDRREVDFTWCLTSRDRRVSRPKREWQGVGRW